MDSVEVLAKLAAIETKLAAVERELVSVATSQRNVTEFIDTMKEVVTEMSTNPMFKAMGIGGFGPKEKPDVPRLPGMPQE